MEKTSFLFRTCVIGAAGGILEHKMSDEAWSVGQYVVALLAANDIDTVFGIPGVHNLELYRGIAATGLRHILVRHEQNAGFAADGFARASGRPAGAFVISGPGLTNILTGVAQARTDSVPMLIVASTPVEASLGKGWGVLHELDDQCEMAAGVTGSARSARSAEDARDHLRAAFASFQVGRQRPAYLEIPLDLLARPTHLRPERFARVGGGPQPSPAVVARAAELLSEAQRPLVIAGGGARSAGEQLLRLIETLDGYLVTTVAGKGVLAESHPASLGASLQFGTTQELVASADVVLAVGTELSETDFYSGTRLEVNGRLIRVDIDATKLADHYAADVGIWGDARASLEAITRALVATAPVASRWRTELGPATNHRSRISEQFNSGARACARLLRAIRDAVPDDAMVFSDMTQAAYLGNYAFTAERPGTWFHPSGYGTLGYALPAAIGALLAGTGRAIVALAGDFGFQFTSQELATAVELELSLPIVLWNNGALGQIRDDMRAAGIAPTAVTGRNPDFVALARAYGAHGVRVRGPEELTEAIRSALQRRGPTLLEAVEAGFVGSIPEADLHLLHAVIDNQNVE
jgi:5-guanidino-2-oxopentanoate decarboxylase